MKKILWDVGIGFVLTGGLGMVIDWFANRIPSVEFWVLLISFSVGFGAMLISWRWFYSFISPVKLKVNELTCWHIERPEPEHHAWHHCHEYNFAGEVSIIPRTEAVVMAFYLNLPMRNGFIRVDIAPFQLPEIIPKRNLAKLSKLCSFQVRLSNEVIIPPYGYVVLKFDRGKAKSKVSIKLDDEYRKFNFGGDEWHKVDQK